MVPNYFASIVTNIKVIIITVCISTLMAELPNKMKNKPIKYVRMNKADIIKLFWNKYVRKNTCQTEERTEHAW